MQVRKPRRRTAINTALHPLLLAKLLDNLPAMFRERYLNTHEIYLKSLADVIVTLYSGLTSEKADYQATVSSFEISKFPIRLTDIPDAEQLPFRHLRNSWYHAVALRYPEDFESRTKFAGWKINQAYYCVYSTVASKVRCLHEKGTLGHDQTLSVYAREFIASRKFAGCFLPPVNTYLDQQGRVVNREPLDRWSYGKENKVPHIVECLEKVREANLESSWRGKPQLTTVVHYLKSLREWATYEDAYLLFRMYGRGVKDNLDFSLKVLCSFYLMHAEVFLMHAFGYEALELQRSRFTGELGKNMGLEDRDLQARFAAYKAVLSDRLSTVRI